MKSTLKFFEGIAAPFIKCRIFNRDVYLLIDTGSNQNLLDKTFFDDQEYCGALDKRSGTVMTGNGEINNGIKVDTALSIDKAEYTLEMVLVDYDIVFAVFEEYLGEKPVGILGMDFLMRYNIVLDFEKWCMLY